MRSSSSNNVGSFYLTPNTKLSELRQALPPGNTTVYATKMTKRDECILYFAPHKDAEAKWVHLPISCLIGTDTSEKRFALLKIKREVTKELTTNFLIGILDEVQRALPQPKASNLTSSFSNFSEQEAQSDEVQSDEVSASFSSFSESSLSEDANKENRPEKEKGSKKS